MNRWLAFTEDVSCFPLGPIDLAEDRVEGANGMLRGQDVIEFFGEQNDLLAIWMSFTIELLTICLVWLKLWPTWNLIRAEPSRGSMCLGTLKRLKKVTASS